MSVPETAGAPTVPAGRLHGKVAVVTGSSGGIGQAIAYEFAREGASVVIN
jgi:3-oxoacyl-[acyl-carrier protein] reductase